MEALTQETYEQYLADLLAGNRRACQACVQTLLDGIMPIHELYEKLFKRSLYDVGDLWAANRISVATEHLSTFLTESLRNLTYPQIFAGERTDKRVVLACVPQERHDLGVKMVSDIFALYGWDAYCLGADVPAVSLLAMLEETQADMLGLSLGLMRHGEALQNTLDAVIAAYPRLPILVGGLAFIHGDLMLLGRYPDVVYVDSLGTLISSVLQV